MDLKKSILVLFLVGIGAGEEVKVQQYSRPPSPSSAVGGSNGGNGITGFTVGKKYNLDAKVLPDGTSSGSLYALLGGQVGPGQKYYNGPDSLGPQDLASNDLVNGGYYRDPQALSQSSGTSIWSPKNVNYYVAGGVFVVVLLAYGLYAFFTSPHAFKKLAEVAEEEDDGVPETQKDTKKSRRRRSIRRNEEAARLASIVLTAIESGECLQKSICLMGSQIGGTEKAKLALTVLEKLIPKSVQENNYYLTLQKSLQVGEFYCQRFKCKF